MKIMVITSSPNKEGLTESCHIRKSISIAVIKAVKG